MIPALGDLCIRQGWLKKITANAAISHFQEVKNQVRLRNYSVFTSVRMHLAHSTFRTFFPASKTVMVCKFGLKVRGVAFLDQGRLRPKAVFFPQLSHFAIFKTSFPRNDTGSLHSGEPECNTHPWLGRAIIP
jgi:hypothetical protein